MRGEVEALLSPPSDFRAASLFEAEEVVRAGSGVNLTIHHSGCAHYTLSFEFTWASADATQGPSLDQAAALLEGVRFKEVYQRLIGSVIGAMRRMGREPWEDVTLSETETVSAIRPAPNALTVIYDVAL